ncbi:hypothetical protein T09_5899, partial [Trichinella sp. T9]
MLKMNDFGRNMLKMNDFGRNMLKMKRIRLKYA